MKKLLILTTLFCTSCTGVSITKPLYGKHFGKRGGGLEYNEDYSRSIGAGYRHKSGLGANYTYAAKNSLGNASNYIHAEYMPEVYSKGDYSVSIGAAVGVRNGYKKKSEGRTNSDFIPSGALQGEMCYSHHCALLQLAPTDTGVFLLSYKYVW